MSRMNYGSRGGSSVVDSHYHYDPLIDKSLFFPAPKPGSLKAVIRDGKLSARNRNNHRGISLAGVPPKEHPRAAAISAREEAEQQLAETVRRVITALTHGLEQLQDVAPDVAAGCFVNPKAVADAILLLRAKSKVQDLP